ncbi:MAG: hypothetical protein EGS41_06560 [Prevotella sp.]|nr:hypothetical protein [Prevotella sp.]
MNIFKIKKEERIPSLIALLVFVLLNGLFFYKYSNLFLQAHHVSYWQLFAKTYHVSGFDAWSYIFMSNGKLYFEIPRHPLFAVILYPFYLINKELIAAGDTNYAMIFMAILLIVSAYYSFIFIYRVFREIIEVGKKDSLLLSAMLYSFGMVMVSMLVPDHFCWSLFLLTMTLYLAGKAMKEKKQLSAWTIGILSFLTGGVTLSNIAKTYLAAWFVNGKKVFAWKNMVAMILPAILLVGTAYLIYTEIREPQFHTDKKIEIKAHAKDTLQAHKDSIHHAWVLAHTGEPMKKEGFWKWTDMSTSRSDALIHNMMGESIQLHDSYLLDDMCVNRPTVVKYNYVFNYIIEGIVALLFILGIIVAVRHRFFLMALSWLALDICIHFVMGFGLNEMYIMACHWIFIIPISIAYLLKSLTPSRQTIVRGITLLLTLYLWVWNGYLVFSYMSDQITQISK